MNIFRGVAFSVSLVLCSCASTVSLATSQCPSGDLADGMLITQEHAEFSLALPIDSVLVDENTQDARYWTWQTSLGQINITWISRIARERLLRNVNADSCSIISKSGMFVIQEGDSEVKAISESLTPNGGGLLVVVARSSNNRGDIAMIRSIVESVDFPDIRVQGRKGD